MTQEKVSRRRYLKYVGAGVIVVGAGAAGYYFLTQPSPSTTSPSPTTVTQTSYVTSTTTTTQTSVTTTTATSPTTTTTTIIPPKKGYTWGDSPYENEEVWYWVLTKCLHFYAEDLGDTVVTLDPHMVSDLQIRDLKYMVAQGVDGIMCAPTSMDGLAATIDWIVKEKKIPVVTYDSDANTSSVSICTRVDSFTLGKQAAEKLVGIMQSKGVKLEGNVFIVWHGPENVVHVARKDGMESVLKQYSGLKIIEYTAQSTLEKAKTAIAEACKGIGKPLIVMATNIVMLSGAIEGLRTAGMAIPYGQEGHVYTGGIDVGPEIIALMKDGLIDVGADQPNLFYGSLSAKFLRMIKEKGENSLPPIGSTVTFDYKKSEGLQSDGTYNVVFDPNKEYKGVRPFANPPPPSKVVEYQGHRWLQLGSILVTPDIAETAPIWANVAKKWFA